MAWLCNLRNLCVPQATPYEIFEMIEHAKHYRVREDTYLGAKITRIVNNSRHSAADVSSAAEVSITLILS